MSSDQAEGAVPFDPRQYLGLSDTQMWELFGSLRMDLLLNLAKTHKIEAIKILRICAGLGLKEAKDVVDVLIGHSVTVPKDSAVDLPMLRQQVAQLRGELEGTKASLEQWRSSHEHTQAAFRSKQQRCDDLLDEVTSKSEKLERLQEVTKQLFTAHQALLELVRQEVFNSGMENPY